MPFQMLQILGIECDFIILYLYVLHVMDSGPDTGRSERCSRHLGKLSDSYYRAGTIWGKQREGSTDGIKYEWTVMVGVLALISNM